MEARYTFKNFTDLNEQESAEVLRGRNDAEVRRWMTTDRVIAPDEHSKFMQSLKASNTQIYLKVDRNGHFAGVYSLTDIRDRSAVGGFWVSDYARRRLLSLCVVFQSIRYVFETFPVEMIRGYQLKTNSSVSKLNALLGFGPGEPPPEADPRMNYLCLRRDVWSGRASSEEKLLKLIETVESRNED